MADETPGEPAGPAPWRRRVPSLLPSAAGLALAPRLLPGPEAGAVRGLAGKIDAERAAAALLWVDLADLPALRRLHLVRGDRRFQTWGLFDLLVHQSRAEAPEDPREALALAELALAVLARLAPRLDADFAAEYRATALAAAADAERRAGRLGRAWQKVASAFAALAEGSQDLFVAAQLHADRGQIAADSGRLQAAASDFGRAARLLERFGNTRPAARVRVQQADVAGHQAPARAVALLQRALPRLDLEAEPRLELHARHRLIWFLNDAGRSWAAARLLDSARPLYERYGEALVRLQRIWLEGRIRRDCGEAAAAETSLYRAYCGFAEIGHAQDLLLCGLDLLELYRQGGLERRAVRLVEEFAEALAGWAYPEEALALWRGALELASHEQFAHRALRWRESWYRFTAGASLNG